MRQHTRVRPILPLLAFVFCASVWGSTFLFIRVSNEALPPMWAATLRLMLAGIILSGLLLATGQHFPRGEAFKAAALYGSLNFGVNFPLLYWGETQIPSGLAAVLYATIPLSSVLFASMVGLEKLEPKRLAAAVVAISGVAIIFYREVGSGENGWGIVAVFLAATVSALGAIFLKKGPKQSILGINAVANLIGVPFCVAASLVLSEPWLLPATTAQLGPLLYLTFAGSIGAFMVFTWLLSQWRATSASFIAVIVPIIAVILGAVFLNERLAPGSWIGALVVIGATASALMDERRKHLQAKRESSRALAPDSESDPPLAPASCDPC